MTNRLVVILEDVVAGSIERLSDGRLRFTYDEEYRSQSAPTPLSLSMPVQVSTHPDHIVTPWLQGLLPDNDRVLTSWSRQFHTSSSPFSLLSTQVGEDCAGAVRFARPEQVDRVLGQPGSVTWLTEDDVAERVRELRADATSWLGREFTGKFSLAGAQAKTALLRQGDQWGEPSGSTPTTHILQPAVEGLDDHDLNEHLCLDAARRAGLLAVKTSVARFAGESAVVVDRYDRSTEGSSTVRVHQEDLCQALSVPPSKKYQNDGGPSPGQVAKFLRRAMAPRIADEAVHRFADALIWNWLIAGTDGHAKNYSLLLVGNHVRLAPLYDVASALPYGTHERQLRLAMKVGGDDRVLPQRNNWPAAADELGLEADDLLARVAELGELLPAAFCGAASAPEVAALDSRMPDRLVELVTERSRRCLAIARMSSLS